MEHVEGKPLSELIPADGLPPESVIRYGTQIADALAHAHERGVIHRDLKSANVVITPDAQVKLIDFGVAVPLPDEEVDCMTRTLESPARTTAVGTIAYMAPEVLRGEAATSRSDIWALGVVIYEMASGRLPFDGPVVTDAIAATLRVAGRTSAFSFKGKTGDLREIGRTLDVSVVLEGSVRRAGNRLRITAELVNVADGYHLWSERYDREMKDVFAVQGEIALAVVGRAVDGVGGAVRTGGAARRGAERLYLSQGVARRTLGRRRSSRGRTRSVDVECRSGVACTFHVRSGHRLVSDLDSGRSIGDVRVGANRTADDVLEVRDRDW